MSEDCFSKKLYRSVLSLEKVWFQPSQPTTSTPNKSLLIWPLPLDFPITLRMLCCGQLDIKTTQCISFFFLCWAIFRTILSERLASKAEFWYMYVTLTVTVSSTYNVQFHSINYTCAIYLLDVPKTNLFAFLKFPRGNIIKNAQTPPLWQCCSIHEAPIKIATLWDSRDWKRKKNRAIVFRRKELERQWWLCVWERRRGDTIPNTMRNKSVLCILSDRPWSEPFSHCAFILISSGSTCTVAT